MGDILGKELEIITEDMFNSIVKIKFNNILDGFEMFKSSTLTIKENKDFNYNEKEFITFLERAYVLNNKKSISLAIDFYIKNLNEDEFGNLLSLSKNEDKPILQEIYNNKELNSIYFIVKDIKIIPFLTRLSTRELFFITYYFLDIPLTIWGNYNLNFPVFYLEEKHIENYRKISKEMNIQL
ncbi:hypothetical protein JCM1393_27410 [Clostridium carnis]